MEIALYIALIIISFTLVGLVILQGRNAGMQSRDSRSLSRTTRGLEQTLHPATIVGAVVFLVLALITSLPIFGTPTPAPVGLAGLLGHF